jgi:hypothetical protein
MAWRARGPEADRIRAEITRLWAELEYDRPLVDREYANDWAERKAGMISAAELKGRADERLNNVYAKRKRIEDLKWELKMIRIRS